MEKAELIFVPVPGLGHLVQTLEFAKRLIDHDDRISITIILTKHPFAPFTDAYTKSQTLTRIQFIDLPQADPPPPSLRKKCTVTYIVTVIESYVPQVRNFISEKVNSQNGIRIAGLVLDFFCVSMIDVANEFNLPSYMYCTGCSGFLDLMLYLPIRHSEIGREVRESDSEMLIPGFVNPVPPTVFPGCTFDSELGYASFLELAQRCRDFKGILVNTFVELESYTLKSFLRPQIPPVYPVGPIVDLNGQPNPELDKVKLDKMMKWLDDQPDSSVVFLCFGSTEKGGFDAAQVKEIALGLELTGCRFLWSVRVPSSGPFNSKDPESILPEGFLERIGERGMICGWAPQVEVLAHRATGGFMSHCGWTSISESLWFGVPIVTWPIYAEQQINAFRMVREWELAVELRLDYDHTRIKVGDNLVMADEIAKAVKSVMDGDNPVRKKVKDMSEIARTAWMNGGSSSNSVKMWFYDVLGSSN